MLKAKILRFLPLCLCLPLCLPLQAEKEGKSHTPKVLQAYGWLIGQQTGLFIGYTEEELEHIIHGIRLAAQGFDQPEGFEAMLPQFQQLMESKQAAFEKHESEKAKKEALVNIEAAEPFFFKLEGNKNVRKTQSGLYYEILAHGKGPYAEPLDSVKVHYRGSLIDGTEFDSSHERNKPVVFVLEQSIPGFREGLQMVKQGGRIKLYIPPHLGYADKRIGPIPPGSTLIFDVELIEVIQSFPDLDEETPSAPEEPPADLPPPFPEFDLPPIPDFDY